ncbi:MAG: hypothetical protein CM15mP49_28610 [Actinomycetota bacterium]|nr:MAG: hypothetical protein CM15mP49_28610 [Actinomycetota bacterium]
MVRVVEIATSQDVGRVLNPVQARGQIEGGIAQGLGLALLEELVLDSGKIVKRISLTIYFLHQWIHLQSRLLPLLNSQSLEHLLGQRELGNLRNFFNSSYYFSR